MPDSPRAFDMNDFSDTADFEWDLADEAEDAAVAALVGELVAGQVDAIAFTSSPQIDRLLEVAKSQGQDAALRRALGGLIVAAIGPVVAEALTAKGIKPQVVPSGQFFMKPLVAALEEAFK